MIKLQWGPVTSPVKTQLGLIASPTAAASQANTPNPVAVLIATNGTAADINWTQRSW